MSEERSVLGIFGWERNRKSTNWDGRILITIKMIFDQNRLVTGIKEKSSIDQWLTEDPIEQFFREKLF